MTFLRRTIFEIILVWSSMFVYFVETRLKFLWVKNIEHKYLHLKQNLGTRHVLKETKGERSLQCSPNRAISETQHWFLGFLIIENGRKTLLREKLAKAKTCCLVKLLPARLYIQRWMNMIWLAFFEEFVWKRDAFSVSSIFDTKVQSFLQGTAPKTYLVDNHYVDQQEWKATLYKN